MGRWLQPDVLRFPKVRVARGRLRCQLTPCPQGRPARARPSGRAQLAGLPCGQVKGWHTPATFAPPEAACLIP